MVSEMHKMNQRVTLWVHPFCNVDSENFVPGIENNYWVKDSRGTHPGFTSWWNGQNAVILGIFKLRRNLKRKYICNT